MERLKEWICQGMEMVLEKSEEISRDKRDWSMDELGKASDIVKDMAEAYKDLIKSQHYYSRKY